MKPTTSPLVTIVTPTFNQAAYIETTIQSVLDQDYPNLEYLVIDGGSTDGTVEILQKYDDAIAYWVSEPDRGQAHALNKGFERANGEIWGYINSDDFYSAGAVSRVVSWLARHPSSDLVYGRCRFVNEAGEPLESHLGSIETLRDILDLWEVWWGGRQIIQPEAFWTRSLAERVGPFREDAYFGMDYDYWVRALRADARFTRMDEDVASFRFTPTQKTSARDEVAEELLKIVQEHLWDPELRLPRRQKKALQAKWLYQRQFLGVVDRSIQAGESKARRYGRCAALIARHPTLLRSRKLRERFFLSSWTRSPPQSAGRKPAG